MSGIVTDEMIECVLDRWYGGPDWRDDVRGGIPHRDQMRYALASVAQGIAAAERSREREDCAQIVEGEARPARAPSRYWPRIPACNFVVQETNPAAKFALKAAAAIRDRKE